MVPSPWSPHVLCAESPSANSPRQPPSTVPGSMNQTDPHSRVCSGYSGNTLPQLPAHKKSNLSRQQISESLRGSEHLALKALAVHTQYAPSSKRREKAPSPF